MTIIYIVIGVVALFILWAIASYNGFIRLRTRTEEAWADIDVQLKCRYDLIPNLIETVKGYASHEKETLDTVVQARASASQMNIDPSSVTVADMEKFAGAQDALSGALGRLFALSESYPDLKANENFLELQRELSDTENKIQAARRFFNTNVRDLNIKVESFPSNLIASMFNFAKKEFFELAETEQEARDPVKVNF